MSAQDFERLLSAAAKELKWSIGETLAVIQGGWLWAGDAPPKESKKTFILGFFSKSCDGKLESLFKRDRKEGKLFIWHIRQELENQSDYEIEFDNIDVDEVDAWWEQEMEDRGVITDESKFYDEKGREIAEPAQTTWRGIKRVLDNWIICRQADRKPEQKWIQAVIERLKREAGKATQFREDYEAAKQMLKEQGLLPPDPETKATSATGEVM